MSRLDYETISKKIRCDFGSGSIFWINDSYSGFKNTVLRHSKNSEAGTKRKDGRYVVNVNKKLYLRSRIVWLLHSKEWPVGHIDHINGNCSDDSIDNLRDATARANAQNVFRCYKNKVNSNYLGVFIDKRKKIKKWRSAIRSGGKSVSLGYFLTELEAYEAYLSAKRKLHEGYVDSNFNQDLPAKD